MSRKIRNAFILLALVVLTLNFSMANISFAAEVEDPAPTAFGRVVEARVYVCTTCGAKVYSPEAIKDTHFNCPMCKELRDFVLAEKQDTVKPPFPSCGDEDNSRYYEYDCPHCGKTYTTVSVMDGEKIICPYCDKDFIAELTGSGEGIVYLNQLQRKSEKPLCGSNEYFQYNCSHCNKSIASTHPNEKEICPYCGSSFAVKDVITGNGIVSFYPYS